MFERILENTLGRRSWASSHNIWVHEARTRKTWFCLCKQRQECWGLVVHTWDHTSWKPDAGGLRVWSSLDHIKDSTHHPNTHRETHLVEFEVVVSPTMEYTGERLGSSFKFIVLPSVFIPLRWENKVAQQVRALIAFPGFLLLWQDNVTKAAYKRTCLLGFVVPEGYRLWPLWCGS